MILASLNQPYNNPNKPVNTNDAPNDAYSIISCQPLTNLSYQYAFYTGLIIQMLFIFSFFMFFSIGTSLTLSTL